MFFSPDDVVQNEAVNVSNDLPVDKPPTKKRKADRGLPPNTRTTRSKAKVDGKFERKFSFGQLIEKKNSVHFSRTT